MHQRRYSTTSRDHRTFCGVAFARPVMPGLAAPRLSAGGLCRALIVILVAAIGGLASGMVASEAARAEAPAEGSPGLAAYYRSATDGSVSPVKSTAYGATIGSGVTDHDGQAEYAHKAFGEHVEDDGVVVWESPSDRGGLFPDGDGERDGRGWLIGHTPGHGNAGCQCGDCGGYHWEFLPKDNIYPFYLADTKASRLAGQWIEATEDHTLLDGTLGGRFGLFRYVDSTPGPFRRGIQADIEGAAQVRLDMDMERDVRAVDFRAGVPISMSFGRFQTRVGYYHLSSHVGDEFLIRNPAFDRQNYSRDVLFLGGAYWLSESMRVYGEAGWAFYSDVCEPWEFVFGIEDAPRRPTGLRGAPFYALNGRLREEVDFGGSLTVQAGWAWQSGYDRGLLRTGLHYFNGKSNQFSFYDDHEELIGAGLWYDF